MRLPLILAAFIGMASTAHAECLSSASAVWAAHPGSHATWRLQLPGHEGTKCWFARGSTNVPTPPIRKVRVVDYPRGTEAAPRTKRASPAPLESQDTSPPTVRVPTPPIRKVRVLDYSLGTEAAPQTDGQARRANPTAPLESQDTSPPTERGPSSILIWGKPMQIDATWEEVFKRRERGAE